MKRCPECRRDYFNETLLYCLDDGTVLLDGPAHSFSAPVDSPTVKFVSPRITDRATLEFSIPGVKEEKPSLNSIAVLPFRDLSVGEEGDYFSEGLSEELLNVLTKMRGLRVAARTSAFSFKDKSATVAEIGRCLNVATVLEGSVRRSGERVRISVQLVTVTDGFHLWSSTYDRTMEDIFAVQDDIAQSVVGELRGLLLENEPAAEVNIQVVDEIAEAVKGRSEHPEAHRLMMLGRYRLDRTTRDDTTKAIECFLQAIEIDSEFALGWAELGRAYSIEAGRSWTPVDEGFARSRQAVERALTIEPGLAEGYAQLGRIRATYDWDLKGAEDAYHRALELSPGNSYALDGASVLAYKLGRFQEALEMSRRVLTHDPLSAAVWHNLGLLCHAAGRLDDAETAFVRALEISPRRFATNALLATALSEMGRFDDAVEVIECEPDDLWKSWAQAIAYFFAGDKKESDLALERVERVAVDADAFQLAEVRAVRGEIDNAFECLERAVQADDAGVTHSKVNPRFRNLLNDDRWPGLLARVGL